MLRQVTSKALTARLLTAPANTIFRSSLPTFTPFSRTFSTSTPSTPSANTNSNTAVAEQQPKTISEIVNRYGGWYSFAGLGAFALLSKEIFIVNEELLLATNFFTVVGVLYFLASDKILEAQKTEQERVKKYMDDLSDCSIEIYQSKILRHKVKIDEVPAYENLKREFSALAEQVTKAKDLKARYAAREATMKRLHDLRSREASTKAEAASKQADAAVQYVRDQWSKAGNAEKQRLIDAATAIIEGKPAAQVFGENDPIRSLFVRYFEQNKQ